ncbi:MAG: tyrosine/phenylalanine carboxypeptidase domain-containing protein [Croceibacterium sp.]
MTISSARETVPAHNSHEALIAACNSADQELHSIAGAFDFLLAISPVNTNEAMVAFMKDHAEKPPEFAYRPLGFDPEQCRHRLQKIDFGRLHEPLIEGLLLEKRRELDTQLHMLECRGEKGFKDHSEGLYGSVSDELLGAAKQILAVARPHRGKQQSVGAVQIKQRAKVLIDHYRAQDSGFDPVIEIRGDVAGMLVSYPTLMIDDSAKISERRVDPLLSHEVSVHLLTGFNGAQQGLSIFSTGLAGYEEIQEGLGVFAEWAVGGLTVPRTRLLAGRVVAVHAMLAGADFLECYRLLHHDCGIRPRRAFGITARVYRSGGLAKDAIYLRGFFRVMEWLADGGDMEPFWRAKIAMVHVPVMEQLFKRGLLNEAKLTPEFMQRESTAKRIARYRQSPSIAQLFDTE